MTRTPQLLLSIGLVLSVAGYSQSVRGTILGTVTDASGAVVRGAKVTAVQTATGLTRTELTNSEGEYSIPQLPVGAYTGPRSSRASRRPNATASSCASMTSCASISRSRSAR